MVGDITDPSDFCRACRGKGWINEATSRGTILSERCFDCRGTGQRTVLVFPEKQAAHV